MADLPGKKQNRNTTSARRAAAPAFRSRRSAVRARASRERVARMESEQKNLEVQKRFLRRVRNIIVFVSLSGLTALIVYTAWESKKADKSWREALEERFTP